jgi:hypothetical protein
VAALTFSFWTAMFGKDYETLWQQTLHRIGRRPDGKGLRRKDFSGPLAQIRALRNRIAHHEPILMWNLPKRYDSILQLTGWLSPPAAAWCRAHSRFEHVYPAERVELNSGEVYKDFRSNWLGRWRAVGARIERRFAEMTSLRSKSRLEIRPFVPAIAGALVGVAVDNDHISSRGVAAVCRLHSQAGVVLPTAFVAVIGQPKRLGQGIKQRKIRLERGDLDHIIYRHGLAAQGQHVIRTGLLKYLDKFHIQLLYFPE